MAHSNTQTPGKAQAKRILLENYGQFWQWLDNCSKEMQSTKWFTYYVVNPVSPATNPVPLSKLLVIMNNRQKIKVGKGLLSNCKNDFPKMRIRQERIPNWSICSVTARHHKLSESSQSGRSCVTPKLGGQNRPTYLSL